MLILFFVFSTQIYFVTRPPSVTSLFIGIIFSWDLKKNKLGVRGIKNSSCEDPHKKNGLLPILPWFVSYYRRGFLWVLWRSTSLLGIEDVQPLGQVLGGTTERAVDECVTKDSTT